MPVWPKSIYTLGANLQVARVAPRLRQKKDAHGQRRAFATLINGLAATKFWREAGIEAGMSYDAFRARVTPRTYEDLAPAIERMRRGEPDVLWRGHCTFFALTAGSTTGNRRPIPVTDDLLFHFRDAGFDALLYYACRIGHAGVFNGRHLFLSGDTTLKAIPESSPRHTYAGNLGGIAALHLPRWAEQHLYEPGTAAAQVPDADLRLNAVIAQVAKKNLSLIAGLPTNVVQFAAKVREQVASGERRFKYLQELWPHLECFVHGGAAVGPYEAELRALLGAKVRFHEVYPAAEGFIAAQDATAAEGLRVIENHGIFFEFIPLADFDEARVAQLGEKAVPLAEVKTGVDYVVLLTTPGGFARYVLGDIVRFLSVTPPRLIPVGRTRLQLNSLGERVLERELGESLALLCTRHNWTLTNFHVAPLRSKLLTGQDRGRHEWWIELRPGTLATPIGPQMAAALDTELQRLNETYAAKRRAGVLEMPTVRLVMPGVFEHWLRHHHLWGGHYKLPAARNDREIADELAQLTNFARD